MEILGTAVRTLAGRAPRTVDLARAVVFGAIQRDQYPPTEALERGEYLRRLDRLDEQRIEGRRWGAIQHLADVVVAGDGGRVEQTLAVRAALPLRQGALMRQEGRTAHEEERERRQADVRHRVAAARLRPFAPVGKTGTDRAQLSNMVLEGAHHLPRIEVCRAAQGRCRQYRAFRRRKPRKVAFATHPNDADADRHCDSVALRTAVQPPLILTAMGPSPAMTKRQWPRLTLRYFNANAGLSGSSPCARATP